jgi:hypothetical protein
MNAPHHYAYLKTSHLSPFGAFVTLVHPPPKAGEEFGLNASEEHPHLKTLLPPSLLTKGVRKNEQKAPNCSFYVF